MKIADMIDFLVNTWIWGLDIGAQIPIRCVVNNGEMESDDKIYFLLKQWRKIFWEPASFSDVAFLDPWGKMKIADMIDFLVNTWIWGLDIGAQIPIREMESDDKIYFLLKQWRKIFWEPASFSDVAFLDPCGEMEISNVIEFHMKHCREALFEAARITGGAILNSCGEMEITSALELHMKHWKDAFSQENGAVSHSDNFGFGKWEVYHEIQNLRDHWREKLDEAYGMSELYSSGDMEISDVIEFNVKRCREALFKAAGISGGAILNSCEEMEISDAIKLHIKYWSEAFSEKAGAIDYFSFDEGTIDCEISNLENHWREKLCEAYGISMDKDSPWRYVLKIWMKALYGISKDAVYTPRVR
ncbi:hypothetical protein DEO72_LG8g2309 [Vigna unguiculata]|uniref:Uncharacterized protein n=1 Tax=Vigna unguiculata TaxID=3917 RepID=A0A4D6MU44_VIGUN|nr:hypothetical protein DEO72_LG8g2309 [Vigna unguiculata]